MSNRAKVPDLRARKRFGKRLRALRKEYHLSQDEVGRASGLDRGYVSGLERGARNPTFDTIVRIAKALDVDVATLFLP